MIERTCKRCHSIFKTWQARIRQGKGLFCSQKCAVAFHMENETGGYKTLFQNGHKQLNTGTTHFTSERMKGRKLSADHIQKIKNSLTGRPQENRRGPNNPRWKGGITEVNKKERTTLDFINWRREVFSRDDWTCQVCNQKGGRLHAHHIRMFSKYPALRFDVSNGVTVCKKCHRLTDEVSRITHVLGGGRL